MLNKYKFAIHTLGCKVNTYESDVISEQLRALGMEETGFDSSADIYIINTCTVTNMADRKSRQMLHKAKKLNPSAVVAAVGCYVDAAMQNPHMKELLAASDIDILISNRDKTRVAELIVEYLTARGSLCADETAVCPQSGSTLGELDDHTRAFIKVQDGCNQFCSYCIIPYVRGRIKSRPVEDVLREVRALTERGVREFIITGIHLSSYGKDLVTSGHAGEKADSSGAKADSSGANVDSAAANAESAAANAETTQRVPGDDIMSGSKAPLLELIAAVNAVPEVKRIRLGSLEPRLITAGFTAELKKNEKLCPHFHLSLQSGSDRILKSMNRHYTAEEYRESCRILREAFEHPAITTDVIVGFPGETEEDFEATREFIREIGFYEAHIFKYSRREGTVADRMPNQVRDEIKNVRSNELIKLAEELSGEFRSYYCKKKVSFIAEQRVIIDDSLYVTGYTDEYVRCIKRADSFVRGAVIEGTADRLIKKKDIDESLLLI